MRPPSSVRARFILAWIAFSVAMSNRPRASPDWLVATTVCQPAWFSRAIASSEPAIGTHSSGDLTKSSRSSLIVPSRSRMMSFIACSARHEGQIGDLIHVGACMLQQRDAVRADLLVGNVDHYFVEERLGRAAERDQRCQGPSVLF